MQYYAFTEHQAELLLQLASAHPRRWEYQIQMWISFCISTEGIKEVLAHLGERRTFLKRAILELPMRDIVQQYINPNSGSLMYMQDLDASSDEALEIIHSDPDGCSELIRNGILHLGPFRMQGVHGKPEEWLMAALANADALLEAIDRLVSLSNSEMDAIDKPSSRFVLDPPVKDLNPVIVALVPYALKYFDGTTAEEIYHAFESGTGTLRVKDSTIRNNSAVLEAIREAFDKTPSQISGIRVITAFNQEFGWKHKSGKSRLYDSFDKYKSNYPNDGLELLRIHNEIKESLRSAFRRMKAK
jgi:hypothetical protein